MKHRLLQVGSLATNCHIIAPDAGESCFVIDPGAEGPRIVAELTRLRLAPSYVLSTHGHADHTGGASAIIKAFGGEYALGRADAAQAADPPSWLTAALSGFELPPPPSRLLGGGETLTVPGLSVAVIATPGHTPGSVCYYVGDELFTGDTLFKDSIGRYDLPGGDGPLELASIRDCLLPLPDATRVHPGHGPSTSIGAERRTNPFLRQA
jgi:glyoxylase-like metal-dependent hydrolase (beta-lactamase superfamily II)